MSVSVSCSSVWRWEAAHRNLPLLRRRRPLPGHPTRRWRRQQYFALLETPDGLGHILKVNDRLGPSARVKEITKDAVLIEMKDEDPAKTGPVRTIRLELQQQQKKEGE